MNDQKDRMLFVATIILAVMLICALISGFSSKRSMIVFAADSQGNDITHIKAFENSTASWVLIKNFTATGQSERVPSSAAVNFEGYVKYNVSLAATNATAQSYSRLNITIQHGATTDVNNAAMTNYATYSYNDTSYYYLEYYYNWTGLTIAGETYNCTFVYQAYY